jgi:phenylacetate-CoA ligase
MTSDLLLALYHRIPSPLQSAVASGRGLVLRSWRYGVDTDRLVAEALERDAWSEAQWENWRAERLCALLHRAATRVPYYREQWETRRRHGDSSSWERLENWPVLNKETVRGRPEAFIADDRDPRSLYSEHTSGTTGTPVRVWWGRETVRQWFALLEARIREWNGVSRFDRWGILGGQLVVPVARRKPPFSVWNAALRQLYLSSYHLSALTVKNYLEEMRERGVTYLWGYASSMSTLARLVQEAGVPAPTLRVAISNAEPLDSLQRTAIASVFGCPVRDTYGMSEIVCGASECAAETLHLWPEVGVPEVLDDETEIHVAVGQPGRLVATGLLNDAMPLVRYELGDRVALGHTDLPCPCGRLLPRLASVEGRADDVLLTRDGRRVGRLDPVFKADLPVREAQIIQEQLDHLRVRIVPAAGFGERHALQIRERLLQRMGAGIHVSVDVVDRIDRDAAGKFRAVVSRLDCRPKSPPP